MVMATKTSVIITDDLDGSAYAETVSFGADGTNYEVDLGAKNRAKLEKALQPFISAARRAPARGRRRAANRAGGPRVDNGAVRAWAKAAGLKATPEDTAHVVVDNDDPRHPVIIRWQPPRSAA